MLHKIVEVDRVQPKKQYMSFMYFMRYFDELCVREITSQRSCISYDSAELINTGEKAYELGTREPGDHDAAALVFKTHEAADRILESLKLFVRLEESERYTEEHFHFASELVDCCYYLYRHFNIVLGFDEGFPQRAITINTYNISIRHVLETINRRELILRKLVAELEQEYGITEQGIVRKKEFVRFIFPDASDDFIRRTQVYSHYLFIELRTPYSLGSEKILGQVNRDHNDKLIPNNAEYSYNCKDSTLVYPLFEVIRFISNGKPQSEAEIRKAQLHEISHLIDYLSTGFFSELCAHLFSDDIEGWQSRIEFKDESGLINEEKEYRAYQAAKEDKEYIRAWDAKKRLFNEMQYNSLKDYFINYYPLPVQIKSYFVMLFSRFIPWLLSKHMLKAKNQP